MTICPKCGKEYSVSPEVCEGCGTVLNDSGFTDPFAEAVEAEASLREQSRLRREARLNPPASAAPAPEQAAENADAPAEDDEDALSEETPAKKKNTGLRAAAVTAALAVAAGGGWYAFNRLGGGKVRATGTDVRYAIDGQAYFLDGKTGYTYTLGEQTNRTEAEWEIFWANTTVSADHSRIFFPRNSGDGEDFIPSYIDLNGKQNAQSAAEMFPLVKYGENGRVQDGAVLNATVSSYTLLDDAGEYVLLQLGGTVNGAMVEPTAPLYAVWQDPEKHNGDSLAMNRTPLQSAWPLSDGSGRFLSLSITDAAESTRINDRTGLENGQRYTLQLSSVGGDGFQPVNTFVTGWMTDGTMFSSDTEQPARYLFYSAAGHGTEPELQDGTVSVSRGDKSYTIVYDIANAGPSGAADQLRTPDGESLASGVYEYGTEFHRFDLRTGQDVLIFQKKDSIMAMSEEGFQVGMMNGSMLSCEMNYDEEQSDAVSPAEVRGQLVFYGLEEALLAARTDDQLVLYSYENGEAPESSGLSRMVLPIRIEDIEYLLPAGPEGNCFFISDKNKKAYLMVFGKLYPLGTEENLDTKMIWRLASNESGTRYIMSAMQREASFSDATLRNEWYLIDAEGIRTAAESDEPVTLPMQKLDSTFSQMVFIGDHLAAFDMDTEPDRPGNSLQIDDTLVSERAEWSELYYDEKSKAVYFLEYGEGERDGSSFRTLCRFKNGEVTRISDIVSESFVLDSETGGFSFVRFEGDGDYGIYLGNSDAVSAEDCTTIAVSRELPLLFGNTVNRLLDNEFAP